MPDEAPRRCWASPRPSPASRQHGRPRPLRPHRRVRRVGLPGRRLTLSVELMPEPRGMRAPGPVPATTDPHRPSRRKRCPSSPTRRRRGPRDRRRAADRLRIGPGRIVFRRSGPGEPATPPSGSHPPADGRPEQDDHRGVPGAHPEVRIEYQTVPNTEFNTKMLTALSSGAGPDIISMDDGALRGTTSRRPWSPAGPAGFGKQSQADVESGFVPARSTAPRDPTAALRHPQRVQRHRLHDQQEALRRRRPRFGEPAETWQEEIAAGKKLNAAGHKQAFNFLYLSSGWYAQWFQTLANQTGGSPMSADGKTATLDPPEDIAALQLWVDLARTSGIADPTTSSRDATSPFQDLSSVSSRWRSPTLGAGADAAVEPRRLSDLAACRSRRSTRRSRR